jgi:hypothetical protein
MIFPAESSSRTAGSDASRKISSRLSDTWTKLFIRYIFLSLSTNAKNIGLLLGSPCIVLLVLSSGLLKVNV